MPEYEVNVNGKPKKIELSPNGEDSYAAKVDGKPCKFSIPKNALTLGKTFTVKVDDKPYQIELARISHTKEFSVTVEKTAFKADIRIPARKATLTTFEPMMTGTKRRAASNKQVLEGAINAPMTGRMVSIKVSKGDNVQKGQVLCVIEAMKMENEISTSKAGVVKEVLVSVGSPVSEGDPLVVIA
jgi:biotin carboxyl carrier protein